MAGPVPYQAAMQKKKDMSNPAGADFGEKKEQALHQPIGVWTADWFISAID
jgi:hypothetical protein